MPTSTTTSKRKSPFSLIELVVSIAIAATLLAVGMLAFRPQLSAARRADQLGRELLTFCARVRNRAMNTGRDCRILLHATDRKLESAECEDAGEETGSDESENREKPLCFAVAEGLEIDTSELEADGEDLEILRFFPDGSASGKLNLTIRIDREERKLTVSALTGALKIEEGVRP